MQQSLIYSLLASHSCYHLSQQDKGCCVCKVHQADNDTPAEMTFSTQVSDEWCDLSSASSQVPTGSKLAVTAMEGSMQPTNIE